MRDQARRALGRRARLVDGRILLDTARDVASIPGDQAVPARALELVSLFAALARRDRLRSDGDARAGLVRRKVVVAARRSRGSGTVSGRARVLTPQKRARQLTTRSPRPSTGSSPRARRGPSTSRRARSPRPVSAARTIAAEGDEEAQISSQDKHLTSTRREAPAHLVPHQAIRLAADRPRVPLLHIPLSALALLQALKVDMDDDVPLALRPLVLGLARQGPEQDKLERGRVWHSREQARADLDAEVKLVPA